MKKIKEFMTRPITWGGYFKLCLISMILGMISSMIFVSNLFEPQLKSWNIMNDKPNRKSYFED